MVAEHSSCAARGLAYEAPLLARELLNLLDSIRQHRLSRSVHKQYARFIHKLRVASRRLRHYPSETSAQPAIALVSKARELVF